MELETAVAATPDGDFFSCRFIMFRLELRLAKTSVVMRQTVAMISRSKMPRNPAESIEWRLFTTSTLYSQTLLVVGNPLLLVGGSSRPASSTYYQTFRIHWQMDLDTHDADKHSPHSFSPTDQPNLQHLTTPDVVTIGILHRHNKSYFLTYHCNQRNT